MARTAEMNPAAIIDTRSQSYAIHRCASCTMSPPLPGPIGEPGAAAYNAVFRGHMTTIVNKNTRKMSTAEHHNHSRYGSGVLHPVTRAPIEAIKIVGDTSMKNCPGSTGKRGPSGRSVSDSGGAALQALARTRKSKSFAPTPTPHASTEIQRNILCNGKRAFTEFVWLGLFR